MAKIPVTQKKGSGKKSGPPQRPGRAKWLLLAAILLAAFLFWLMPDVPDGRKISVLPGRAGVEKTESGGNVDYVSASQKMHQAVDKGLNDVKGIRKDVKESNRETLRTNGAGHIRWHNRQLLLSVSTEMNRDEINKALTRRLKESGGEVLAVENDRYQGMTAIRFDLGLRDTLAGDPVTIVTDRIYLVGEKGSEPRAREEIPRPSGKGKGELAIVVDDFGYTAEPISAFINIGRPLTFAVLPYRPHSGEAVARANAAGLQAMLHLPLEPMSEREESENITITAGMSDEEIQRTVNKAIASMPGVIGVNNHQGSRATTDRRVMREVLTTLRKQNLFFLDSRTSGQSVAVEVSRQLGVKSGENELFLDNSSDVGAIKKQLRAAGELAIRHGSATVICHARPNTAIALREVLAELESQGVRLVYVSKLVR